MTHLSLAWLHVNGDIMGLVSSISIRNYSHTYLDNKMKRCSHLFTINKHSVDD